MRNVNVVTKVMVTLAAVGLCFPSAAIAATAPAKPKVMDVALLEGNVLVGQLVNTAGGPMADAKVMMQGKDQSAVALKTNKEGVFAVKGVPAGVYSLASKDTQGVYRLWAPKTAPPNAQKGALLVSGNEVARGQYARGLRNMLANPWIVAGIVACAVAIPVAIHNSNHSSPSSP